ncbi:MAG: N-acetylmuramoyl-L-alanine amidase family protein, partial [Verrucomicrobiales bacterium]
YSDIFSYPVESSAGKTWISKIDLTKLVDPVLRPSFIGTAGNFRTVIIDPGHGGKDPGATNSLGTEAGYNLKVSRYLKEILEKEYHYRVIMTRESDRYLSLQQRVELANRVKENAIFISIHHNSGQRKARGIETFTLSPVGVSHYGRGLRASDFRAETGNHHDSANVALATSVHGSLLTMLEDPKTGKAYTLDRGIKRARFSVLTGVHHPSILVECGFMTHQYEARLINDTGYQRTLAKSIAYAVQKYRFAVGRPQGNNPRRR